MALTFTAELLEEHWAARRFEVRCEDSGLLTAEPLPMEAAYGLAEAHKLECGNSLCQDYGADVDEVAENAVPELNVHDGSAVRLLVALGYLSEIGADQIEAPAPSDDVEWPDLSGEADAEEFLGRCLLALAIAPVDEGMPARVGATSRETIGGRSAGRLQAQLAELAELARWCSARCLRVCWH